MKAVIRSNFKRVEPFLLDVCLINSFTLIFHDDGVMLLQIPELIMFSFPFLVYMSQTTNVSEV